MLIINFIKLLIKFDDIMDTPRAVCPKGHEIWGAIYPGDGGLGGFAAAAYILSEESDKKNYRE